LPEEAVLPMVSACAANFDFMPYHNRELLMERLNPIAVLIKNEPGVLTQAAGLFTRRGLNIISLAVGEAKDPAVSRMSAMVSGDDAERCHGGHALDLSSWAR
jgi:hypothetical protein